MGVFDSIFDTQAILRFVLITFGYDLVEDYSNHDGYFSDAYHRTRLYKSRLTDFNEGACAVLTNVFDHIFVSKWAVPDSEMILLDFWVIV